MENTSLDGQEGLPRYFPQVFSVARQLERGRLDFVIPDGRRFRVEGARPGPAAELSIHDDELFARLIREGDLGFCDAYVDGGWSSPDLLAFMDLLHEGNNSVLDGYPAMRLAWAWESLRHWWRSNSRRQAKKNIAHHYDLGNDFYALWLDETMTYSSGLFLSGQESLEAAQRAKYAAVVDHMGVRPGEHVLEIGCGWGGFAEYAAAERGLKVTAVTISAAQRNFAAERMARAGLADRVRVELADYRDLAGRYDGIASIEMFEAVGEAYWPRYFEVLHGRLKPGRQATLQVITVADHRWDVYRRGVDFIQKYIFPGGMLPCPRILHEQIGRSGLSVVNNVPFGESYSQTLRRWHEAFNSAWDSVAALGFDERFRRMWNFYLASCAALFRGGNCDVVHITVRRST
ncbi:MAG: class I SAM-dependent methyltransferase [Paracoccaceae bacterium]